MCCGYAWDDVLHVVKLDVLISLSPETAHVRIDAIEQPRQPSDAQLIASRESGSCMQIRSYIKFDETSAFIKCHFGQLFLRKMYKATFIHRVKIFNNNNKKTHFDWITGEKPIYHLFSMKIKMLKIHWIGSVFCNENCVTTKTSTKYSTKSKQNF